MTGLPDNNGNDFIRGLETRACVNGMTKSDVERLKNALVKKILDDETVIDVTEDGSIIADSNGLYLSIDGQKLGLSIDGEDIIPVTVPYLPEDENENPLAPPNDTIMTSANIAVDPRIVHTTGNELIIGSKIFNTEIITQSIGIPINRTLGYHKILKMGKPAVDQVIYMNFEFYYRYNISICHAEIKYVAESDVIDALTISGIKNNGDVIDNDTATGNTKMCCDIIDGYIYLVINRVAQNNCYSRFNIKSIQRGTSSNSIGGTMEIMDEVYTPVNTLIEKYI